MKNEFANNYKVALVKLQKLDVYQANIHIILLCIL